MPALPAYRSLMGILHFLFVFLLFSSVSAQTTFTLDNESRIWIEGSSNVNEFDCRAIEYSGTAKLNDSAENPKPVENEQTELTLRIYVESFDCGRERMNRDLKNALKYESHPEIIFQFLSAEVVSERETEMEFIQLRVRGKLTVAGFTREIIVNSRGTLLQDGRIRAVGEIEINMTDYQVTPPSALLGLVKANDQLTVFFDLLAKPTETE